MIGVVSEGSVIFIRKLVSDLCFPDHVHISCGRDISQPAKPPLVHHLSLTFASWLLRATNRSLKALPCHWNLIWKTLAT